MAELRLELETDPSEDRQEAVLACELCAIGTAFVSADAARLMVQMIPPEAWYSPAHATIAKHIAGLLATGDAVDFVTVRNSLSTTAELGFAGGVEYLIQAADAVPSASGARTYLAQLLKFYQRRLARDKSREIAKNVWKTADAEGLADLFFQAARDIMAVQPAEGGNLGDPVDAKQTASQGIPSGFRAFDSTNRFGGFGRGQLHLVMADSNAGKTSLMVQMILAACYGDEFVRAAVVSTEMNRADVRAKAMRQLTGWDNRPDFPGRVQAEYDACDAKLRAMNVQVIGRNNLVTHQMSIEHIAAWVESQHREAPLDVVYLDMFQLFGSRSDRFRSEVAEREYVSAECLGLAHRLNCAVILTSQVTESERSREPKGSRRPFEDASTVFDMKLDRKEGTRTLRKVKDRYGPAPLEIEGTWNAHLVRFDEVEL